MGEKTHVSEIQHSGDIIGICLLYNTSLTSSNVKKKEREQHLPDSHL
jgi:hypothetical protein